MKKMLIIMFLVVVTAFLLHQSARSEAVWKAKFRTNIPAGCAAFVCTWTEVYGKGPCQRGMLPVKEFFREKLQDSRGKSRIVPGTMKNDGWFKAPWINVDGKNGAWLYMAYYKKASGEYVEVQSNRDLRVLNKQVRLRMMSLR